MNDISGWIGASMLLLAYALSSTQLVSQRSPALQLINLAGATLLAVSAAIHGAKALLVLNTIWAFVALLSTARLLLPSSTHIPLLSPLFDLLGHGLPKTVADTRALAEAQRKNQTADNKDRDLINHLYASLSAIDAKSGALLTNNSVWIAVVAIFLASDGLGISKQAPWELLTALVAFLLFFSSCGLTLFTIYIRWSSAEELANPTLLAETLIKVRADRTFAFRLAVFMSSIGAALLACIVVVKYVLYLSLLSWA